MADKNETNAIIIATDGSVEAVGGLGKGELWREIRPLVGGTIEALFATIEVAGHRCQMLYSEAGRLLGMEPNETATALMPEEFRQSMSVPLVGPVVLVRTPRNPSHSWQLFSEEDATDIRQSLLGRGTV